MSWWLHPEAESELGDAAVYYASHASRAIALAFVLEFERVLGLLVANQFLGGLANDGLRVYPFKRFPHSVVYRDDSAGPRIYAVAHQRREPEYWNRRI